MKIYAGIGARATPPDVLAQMTAIARDLAADGWLLRSGGADGADKAFEAGCDEAGGAKEIWLPWQGFNGSSSRFIISDHNSQLTVALAMAAVIHPAWSRCSDAVRRLYARNVLQVLGGDFETPADKVIAWTPNGAICGGTATALVLAQQHNIEIVNLAVVDCYGQQET